MRSRLVVLLLVLVAPLLVTTPVGPTATASPGRPGHLTVEVLSNRADLVSAGDALVAVRIPHGVRPGQVRVTVDDRDVTKRFAVRKDGQFVGLVRGLEVGRNVIRAKAPGAQPDRVVVTDHPNGGPLFSGPQTQHYRCQETAADAQCNEAPTYDFLYQSTDPTKPGLQAYDPADPPSDVATTTTDPGVE